MLTLHARSRLSADGKEFPMREDLKQWDARKTALVICDMWDKHWCAGATKRVGEMAPRMNALVVAARKKGALIIHCPSDTLDFYKDTPQRKLAQDAPKSETKIALQRWVKLDPAREGPLPIDDSDGGCDCQPQCAQGRAWKCQIEVIGIEKDDAITDSGEAFHLMQQRGIENVIVMGVHTNMCVLGRPFSIRQMVMQGKNVVVVRDMTDSLYNPRKTPFVNHFSGTDLVIDHIEKYWCPSILSSDLLGGNEFRFKDDARPRIAIIMAEDEYKTERTLPEFARANLDRDFKTHFIFGDAKDKYNLPGLSALDTADAALISVRRRVFPKVQMDKLKSFVAAGKPIVGIRTASHAFSLRPADKMPDGCTDWPDFDRDVLGGSYHNHHGADARDTFVWAVPGAEKHPVMAGVSTGEIAVSASLYKTEPLAAGTTLLMLGRFKDNLPHEPIAWTFQRKDGGKTFYTSLGHADEFKQSFFTTLLRNGIYWAAGVPVPESVKEK